MVSEKSLRLAGLFIGVWGRTNNCSNVFFFEVRQKAVVEFSLSLSLSLSLSPLLFSLQRLREFKVNVREFTDANDDANKFKNRIANALPCE